MHPTVGGCHLAFSVLITLWGLSQETGAKMQISWHHCCLPVGEKLPVISDPGVLCLLPASVKQVGYFVSRPVDVKISGSFGYTEPLTEVSKVRSANIHTDIYRINSQ